MRDDRYSPDPPIEQRVGAERDDPFLVFHVGLRINEFWKLHRWLPIILIAPRMVRELVSDPESGLPGNRNVIGPGLRHVGFVQYWDSFDALREYARDSDRLHFQAWQDDYEDGTGAPGTPRASVGGRARKRCTWITFPDSQSSTGLPPHRIAVV